jgi:DedD protein
MGFSLFGKDKQSASDTGAGEREGKATPRRRRKGAEEPVDPVLPEKKRARRRLVGAAAMVLAAIIGLPMLLESEPQPLSDDVQVYIPSIDKPATDTTVAAAEPPVISAAPDDVSAQAPASTTSSSAMAPAAPSEKPSEATAPKAEIAKAESSKIESTKVDSSKAASPVSESPKTSQSAPSTESQRIAQVKALLEGKSGSVTPAKAPAQVEQGKFVLQVAALGSMEKAKELQGRLSKSGIKSYTEKVKAGNSEQVRVRVGPFASREEADKMRSKLSGMGLGGMVIPI